jgi:PhnB protein
LAEDWPVLAILFSSIKESTTMARVSTYLNFPGTSEEAFTFYAQVFGTQVSMLQRFSDMAIPGGPQLSEEEQPFILDVEVETLGGHVLMATDLLPSTGQEFRVGNNVTLNLEPDTNEDADRLYAALAQGGSDSTGMSQMPWGAYWGCRLDRFGVRWMLNVAE